MSKSAKNKVGRPPAEVKLHVQTTTRISDEMNARLNAAAKEIDRPTAWILRTALQEWLDRATFLSISGKPAPRA